jgi:hypothetical protein
MWNNDQDIKHTEHKVEKEGIGWRSNAPPPLTYRTVSFTVRRRYLRIQKDTKDKKKRDQQPLNRALQSTVETP